MDTQWFLTRNGETIAQYTTEQFKRAVAKRVLRPTEYLGRPLNGAEVLAPGAEMSIQLRLETPRIKATGYELLLFYP